ncbi:MAG: WbqC family protein [Bacteroidia bacterium]|nr:WbqC family protein [Bacteroidia bacterium]
MNILPAYIWPPLSWVQLATTFRTFQITYPPYLPKGSYYARYWLPEGRWLSIPLLHSTKRTPWDAQWPPDKPWRAYHWRTLLTLYGKAPFFYEWKPFLEYLYVEGTFHRLQEVCTCILKELSPIFGWQFSWCVEPLPVPEVSSPRETSILSHLLRMGI